MGQSFVKHPMGRVIVAWLQEGVDAVGEGAFVVTGVAVPATGL